MCALYVAETVQVRLLPHNRSRVKAQQLCVLEGVECVSQEKENSICWTARWSTVLNKISLSFSLIKLFGTRTDWQGR